MIMTKVDHAIIWYFIGAFFGYWVTNNPFVSIIVGVMCEYLAVIRWNRLNDDKVQENRQD